MAKFTAGIYTRTSNIRIPKRATSECKYVGSRQTTIIQRKFQKIFEYQDFYFLPAAKGAICLGATI